MMPKYAKFDKYAKNIYANHLQNIPNFKNLA